MVTINIYATMGLYGGELLCCHDILHFWADRYTLCDCYFNSDFGALYSNGTPFTIHPPYKRFVHKICRIQCGFNILQISMDEPPAWNSVGIYLYRIPWMNIICGIVWVYYGKGCSTVSAMLYRGYTSGGLFGVYTNKNGKLRIPTPNKNLSNFEEA